jgi:hypothetical protein
MSTTDSFMSHSKLPQLTKYGSNWIMYKEEMTTLATARGLRRHLEGCTLMPIWPVLKSPPADLAKPDEKIPMTPEEMEEYEEVLSRL